MVLNFSNRFVAYNSSKKKLNYKKEYSNIEFVNSEIEIPTTGVQLESFKVSSELIEKVVVSSIKIVKNYLEKRVKRFVFQYSRKATNIQAGTFRVPKIIFTNNIYLNGAYEESLKIELSPLLLKGTSSFVYELDNIMLKYSKALTSKWSNVFDYNIKLTLFFLKGNEIIKRELDPLVIQSVGFNKNTFNGQNIQTSIIKIQDDACLIEVMLDVVETNPAKVNTESIINLLNENDEKIEDKLKRIVAKLFKFKT